MAAYGRKQMNVQQRLQFAAAGEIVCRTLKITRQKITYETFGQLIGLIPTGSKWHPRYIKPITVTLAMIAASGGDARDVIINATTGEPGVGVDWQPRLDMGKIAALGDV